MFQVGSLEIYSDSVTEDYLLPTTFIELHYNLFYIHSHHFPFSSSGDAVLSRRGLQWLTNMTG
jgi:hypothetical protein